MCSNVLYKCGHATSHTTQGVTRLTKVFQSERPCGIEFRR